MNDRLGGTTESLDGGNIRYYGASPNNYIDIGDKYETSVTQGNWVNAGAPFADSAACNDWATQENITDEQIIQITNNEYTAVSDFCSTSTIPAGTPILWRVIGVFDGKLRIRRNDSIGAYSFDTSDSSINSGWGINQWGPSGSYEGADLMRLLNPGYESNSINNSLYWTSGNGRCYNGKNNDTTSCNFTNTGLSSTAKRYVVDQTLYLGGFSSNQIYANVAYSTERETNVIQNPADSVTRTLSWTGKVGLIYPSDYGYAADFTNDNCKSNLYNNSQSCTETWMNGEYWMISPWAAAPHGGVDVHNDGFNNDRVGGDYGGWPVLTLSSDALLETGDGSKNTPYVLAA